MEKTSGSKEEQMPLNSWSNVIRGLSMNNLANEITCVGEVIRSAIVIIND
jgi:hypothetical protein